MPKPRRAERASCLALRYGGALVAVLLGLGLGGQDGFSIRTTISNGLHAGVAGVPTGVPDRSRLAPPPARVRQGGGRAGAGGMAREHDLYAGLRILDRGATQAKPTFSSNPRSRHQMPAVLQDPAALADAVDAGGRGLHDEQEPDPAALICGYSWPCAEALAVARCESGLDPNATNGSSIGLFQIDYEAHKDKTDSREALRDPAENVRVAHDIWLDQSWWAWRWSAGCHGLVPGSLPAAGMSEGG